MNNMYKGMMRSNIILASMLIFIIQLNTMPTLANNNELSKSLKYYLGSVVNTGKDTGYYESNMLDENDPHYGWKLGEFFVTGYTNSTVDKDDNFIFLKNVGDKVGLYFNLEQDINELNGNSELTIAEDDNGYDRNFEVPKQNFGRGTLIVRHTDYQNMQGEAILYTNYLEAKVSKDADTKIELFEEGDYEVSLNYEIKNSPRNIGGIAIFPTYSNYRISFKFSVRNGNCMVYLFDLDSEEELTNTSITDTGFRLDLAKSRYLDVNIKKEILKEGNNGLIEDTRYNRPAKDGDEYTEEGVYTITVSNPYTNQQTVKKIYVGTNDILKANVTTGLSINDIEKNIENGAKINSNGTILLSNGKVITSNENISNEEVRTDKEKDKTTIATKEIKKYSIVAITVIIILIIFAIMLLRKKKKSKINDIDIKHNNIQEGNFGNEED